MQLITVGEGDLVGKKGIIFPVGRKRYLSRYYIDKFNTRVKMRYADRIVALNDIGFAG